MRPDPLVSVIIPTYNRADVICSTIDNVLAQTYQNIEIIVVDDGSTDATHEKLRQFDRRIRIIGQSNRGPAAARNRGFEAARGEYIAFQDSDDLWLPEKIQRQVNLLNRANRSVVCCLCNAVFQYQGRPGPTSFNRAWLFPCMEEGIWTNVAEVTATRFVLFCQTSLIRRDVLARLGGFDQTFKYNEDYELALRLSLEGPWAIISDPLTIWQHGVQGNLSFSEIALHDEVTLKACEVGIRLKILAKLQDTDEHRRVRTLLLRELARNRRELRRAEALCNRSHRNTVARFSALIDRYCWGIYRRCPLYPKLKLESLEPLCVQSGLPRAIATS